MLVRFKVTYGYMEIDVIYLCFYLLMYLPSPLDNTRFFLLFWKRLDSLVKCNQSLSEFLLELPE